MGGVHSQRVGRQLINDFPYQVLSEFVQRGDISEKQAISLTKKALFGNANDVYNLLLEPTTYVNYSEAGSADSKRRCEQIDDNTCTY